MALKANLFTTVILNYEDHRGYERETQVEVDYTFDGEELNIVKTHCLDDWDDSAGDFFDLVFEAVEEEAAEAYAEWRADYGEWLYEQAQDREAAE